MLVSNIVPWISLHQLYLNGHDLPRPTFGRIFSKFHGYPYNPPSWLPRASQPVIPVAGKVGGHYKYLLCSSRSPCTVELRLLIELWFGWRFSSISSSISDLRCRFHQVCELCSTIFLFVNLCFLISSFLRFFMNGFRGIFSFLYSSGTGRFVSSLFLYSSRSDSFFWIFLSELVKYTSILFCALWDSGSRALGFFIGFWYLCFVCQLVFVIVESFDPVCK